MPEITTPHQPGDKRRQAKYTMTEEDFERLLSVLDPNRETAAEKYLALKKRLLPIFYGQKDPEAWVDETIDRYAKKLRNHAAGEFSPKELKQIGEQVGEEARALVRSEIISKVRQAGPYCIGIAKNIKLELHKRPPEDSLDEPDTLADRVAPEMQSDLADCYYKCLRGLEESKRELVINYVDGEGTTRSKNREQLAGTKPDDSAEEKRRKGDRLRKEVSRLKTHLKKCTENCLKGKR